MSNATIITTKLDSTQLINSIDKLVKDVSDRVDTMAGKFTNAMQQMSDAMKNFALTQKVSVDLMKDAWRNMSDAFDAMVKAQQGTAFPDQKPKTYDEGTVGWLENVIQKERTRRKEMLLNSEELERQNKLLKTANDELNQQKKSGPQKELETALGMNAKTLPQAQKKLAELVRLQQKYANNAAFSVQQQIRLNKAIEQTRAQIDKLRPLTMKEVTRMSEGSVADIAKKMQALRQVKVDPNNILQVRELGSEYQRLSRLQADLLGKSVQLTHSNNYLAQSFGYIRNRLVYAATLGAATQFVKNLYEVRSQYELLERSLGVLVNSFERGSFVFQELSKMALQSPFTLIELAGAAKQLTAYNFEAKEVVDTTRRLADVSSALGVPMERLVYNLGQIRAQTVLTARDARDFANAGLPIIQELAKHYSELEGRIVTTGDVYDRMSKKMVTYSDVMTIINSVTDEQGKFFEFQAKQAETLRVKMANLGLAWNNALNEIAQEYPKLISGPLSGLQLLVKNWKLVDNAIWQVVFSLGAYKTTQLFINNVLGASAKQMQMSIIAEKQKIAAELQRKAVTQQLTAEELKLIATQKVVTTEDYRSILATKSLTKEQAMLLVAFNRKDIALKRAIIQTGLLTAAEIKSITAGKIWSLTLNTVGLSLLRVSKAILALFANPWTWIFVGITAFSQLVMDINEANKAVRELNQEIKEGAKEASDSMVAFLNNKGNKNILAMAKENALSAEQGEKAWTAIQKQIEQSALSSEALIAKLWNIKDINERVKEGFNYVESIQQAQAALLDLSESGIKITSDLMWGLFGEGLVSDLQDFHEELVSFTGDYKQLTKLLTTSEGVNTDIAVTYKEFEKELRVTSQSIADFLQRKNITDPLQIAEVLERVRANIKAKNPAIKGEMADLFDIRLDQQLYELTNGAVDRNTTLWKMFVTRLKHQSSSAFQDITNDWILSEEELSASQQDAVDKNLEYFKKSVPYAYDALKKMVEDANQLKIQIGVAMNVQQLTDLQQQVQQRIRDAAKNIDFGSKALLPNQNEDFSAWVKRLQDNIKSLEEDVKKYERDTTEWSQQKAEKAKEEIQQNKNLLDLFNQLYAAEKKGSQKDELGNALAKEVEIIRNIRQRYKEYRDMGVNTTDALKKSSDEYRKSLSAVNDILRKSGLSTLSTADIATKPIQDIRNFLKGQLESISETVKRIRVITYDAAKEEKSEIEGVSKALVEQFKIHEGLRLEAYQDENNVWTIGYGHSAKAPTVDKHPVYEGLTITKEEAYQIMLEDIAAIKQSVDATIGQYEAAFEPIRDMTASQYEALLDFTYQYGAGGLKKVLEYAKGDMQKIADALGDTTLVGLKNWAGAERREWRQAMVEGRTMTVDAAIQQSIEELVQSGKGVESLEKTIANLNVEISKVDYKHIVDGLNNELQKVKESYELSVDLEASPELADVFSDIIGIDKESISSLPKNFSQIAQKLQNAIVNAFAEGNLDEAFNIEDLLNKKDFDNWAKEREVELSSSLIKALDGLRQYLNKVRLDETKKQVEEWDKLLEKYSEYEYKRKQITEQYEREMQTARAKNASKDILNAITRERDQKIAQTDFEQFQTTPQWITATGNLADLTRDALGLLINEIEQYKRKAKNLTPKQIKEINRALTALYKQQRKNNPFHAIADAIDEARNTSENYNEAIDNQNKKIKELEDSLGESEEDYDEINAKIDEARKELERLKDAQNKVGQIDASVVVGGINEMVSVAQQGVQAFTELAEAIGGNAMTNASKVINNIMDVMQQAGTGAAIGAQIGGGWGAAIGAIAGTAQGLAIKIAKKISGDSSIDKEIAKSTLAVKQLENAYRLLEDAVNDAYGEAELSAKRLVIANKELQLEELKRQLQLEKSRKKKNRDKSKIADLEGQIIDLELEIKNAINDLTNSLLGIQSVGDAMSSVMDSFIEALRNGEDAMAVFDESVDDMIANMVKRMFTTKILQPWFEGVWDNIQNDIDSRSEQAKKDLEYWTDIYNTEKDKKYKTTKDVANIFGGGKNKTYTKDEVLAIIEQRMQEAQDTILASSAPTMDDIRRYAELLRSGQPILAENMKAIEDYLRELGLINDKADSSLSALQQGIQSITEPTASAIEGYLNIMSQRMFEQNDFIRQIVDVIAKPDESLEDVKVASLSRLLYEMQQSTQIQRSIYNILNGVVAPNGLSLNVSMI